MSNTSSGLSEDHLLGGRVRLLQPLDGYRAAIDPVLLAAAVPTRVGERVLDLGCGPGAAALSLAARVEGLVLTGLEIQPAYAALARQNARANGAPLTVIEGDVAAPPSALRALTFEHAMMNPPFYATDEAMPAAEPGRDKANREGSAAIADWVACALARLVPRGSLTVIHRAERLPEILAALSGRAGAIVVRPLAARIGRDAKRVLVQARKGARGPFRLAAPLVLHAGIAHVSDGNELTHEASAVLRGAAVLPL